MTNIQFGPFCFRSLYVNNYLSAADSSSLKVQPPLPRDRRRLSTQLFGSQRFRHPRIVGLHICLVCPLYRPLPSESSLHGRS